MSDTEALRRAKHEGMVNYIRQCGGTDEHLQRFTKTEIVFRKQGDKTCDPYFWIDGIKWDSRRKAVQKLGLVPVEPRPSPSKASTCSSPRAGSVAPSPQGPGPVSQFKAEPATQQAQQQQSQQSQPTQARTQNSSQPRPDVKSKILRPPTDWYKHASTIIKRLEARPMGHLFSKPVDTELYQCPDYYVVVKRPMDFETLAKKVADRAFSSPHDFRENLGLIWHNAVLYNGPDHLVAKHANELKELADKMWEQYSLETWEADQEAYRQQKEAQAAAAALAAQQQAAGKGKAAGGGGTLARQNSTGKATSAGTAAVSSAPAPPPKPTEEDLARGVVDPADSRHMVNVTLNQPANDKLAAIVGAYFDKRCTEPALQAQFLKQLAVTCHFRDGDAGVTKYLGLLAPKLQQRSEQLWAYLEPHARAPFFCELLSQLAGMLGGSEAQKQAAMSAVIDHMGPLAYKKLAQLMRNIAVAQSKGDTAKISQGAKLLQHWQSSAAFYEHAVRLISELGAGCHRAALMQLLLSHSLDAKGLLDALSSGAAGQQQGAEEAMALTPILDSVMESPEGWESLVLATAKRQQPGAVASLLKLGLLHCSKRHQWDVLQVCWTKKVMANEGSMAQALAAALAALPAASVEAAMRKAWEATPESQQDQLMQALLAELPPDAVELVFEICTAPAQEAVTTPDAGASSMPAAVAAAAAAQNGTASRKRPAEEPADGEQQHDAKRQAGAAEAPAPPGQASQVDAVAHSGQVDQVKPERVVDKEPGLGLAAGGAAAAGAGAAAAVGPAE